jgi:hypothetical protein
LKGVQDTFDIISGLPIDTTESVASIFGPALDAQPLVEDNPSPVFLSRNSLNVNSAASPQILTNKLFAYLGYQWDRLQRDKSIQPYIGFGVEVEFEGINQSVVSMCDVSNNTISQWLLQWRAGFLFG